MAKYDNSSSMYDCQKGGRSYIKKDWIPPSEFHNNIPYLQFLVIFDLHELCLQQPMFFFLLQLGNLVTAGSQLLGHAFLTLCGTQ